MFTVKSRVSTWYHIPVKPYQFWPSTTHVKLVQNSWQQTENVYSREYTWKHVLVEWYQLWTSMTCANWFRNCILFAGRAFRRFSVVVRTYCMEGSFLHQCIHLLLNTDTQSYRTQLRKCGRLLKNSSRLEAYQLAVQCHRTGVVKYQALSKVNNKLYLFTITL